MLDFGLLYDYSEDVNGRGKESFLNFLWTENYRKFKIKICKILSFF